MSFCMKANDMYFTLHIRAWRRCWLYLYYLAICLGGRGGVQGGGGDSSVTGSGGEAFI